METRHDITAAVFAAYMKCPTKAYLQAHAEKPPDPFFADIGAKISTACKVKAGSIPSIHFSELADLSCTETYTAFVDQIYVPVLYSAWGKPDQSDHLLVSFCALAIGQEAGTEPPPSGKIVFGGSEHAKTVKVADCLPKVRKIIDAILKDLATEEPPPLVLNKHCPVCDFQSRCRAIASRREDLSLLGAMTAKELAKCAGKGIKTITQLSYGYRPRRRKRIKTTVPPSNAPFRHDHKLKALAMKKLMKSRMLSAAGL